MSDSLIDILTSELAGPFTSLTSKYLGEPAALVKSGLGLIIPTLLGSFLKDSGTPDGLNRLLGLLNANNLPVMSDANTLLAPNHIDTLKDMGQQQLNALFGSKLQDLTSTLSGESGLNLPSMGSLLALATPFILGLLRRRAGGGTLDASNITSLFQGQSRFLSGKLSSALAGLLGLGSLLGAIPRAATEAVGDTGRAAGAVAAKSGLSRWLPWLIGLAVILFGASMFRGCSEKPVTPEIAATPAPPPEPSAPAEAIKPAITSPADARVYFDVDVTQPAAGSKEALLSIIEYAKANPSAKLGVTGYHDKNGDMAHNKDLAKNRATAVQDILIAAGVPGEQIILEEPVSTLGDATNDQEARHVDVKVK